MKDVLITYNGTEWNLLEVLFSFISVAESAKRRTLFNFATCKIKNSATYGCGIVPAKA